MSVRILEGDALAMLQTLESDSIHCVVTSPPYWGLRDYGVTGQLGLEKTPDEYVANMVSVFREVRRVLRDDGTLWLNLGDSYASGEIGRHDKGRTSDPSCGANEKWLTVVRRNGKRPDGLKPKDLVGIPWRVAFALQADGWYLRSDVIEEVEFYCPCGCGHVMEERVWRYAQDREAIWKKPNPMPESVTDRPTKAHEYLFLLTKSERYYYDAAAIAEPLTTAPHAPGNKSADNWREIRGASAGKGMSGHLAEPDRVWSPNGTRNRRSVWTVATRPYKDAHFATFPPDLIEPCILAGCPKGGTVLDPFGGAGTTGLVADRLGRGAVLIELNPEYAKLARQRISGDNPLFDPVEAA